jgi:beta-phosphoglucomutase-like phosphatase (HAD superfamily)
MFSNKKAVIFDLDGTLINSLDVWNEVDLVLWEELTGSRDRFESSSTFRLQALWECRSMTNPYVGYSEKLAQWLNLGLSGAQVHAKRFAISRRLLKTSVRLREGAADVVRYLKGQGKRLGIATTTRQCNVDIYCDENESIRKELLFRDVFELMLTCECVTQIKPDPEVYCLMLERLGLPARDCLVVEDSLEGVTAAVKAGIDVVAIRESWSLEDADRIAELTEHYVESHADLLKLFAG